MFRRDKMHGCGQIVSRKDGSSRECIYQNHKRICFTDGEGFQATQTRPLY
jgi:hypothetical protein